MLVMMACNYGGFKKGREYPLIKQGYDWVMMLLNGRGIYVPKPFTGRPDPDYNDFDDFE